MLYGIKDADLAWIFLIECRELLLTCKATRLFRHVYNKYVLPTFLL